MCACPSLSSPTPHPSSLLLLPHSSLPIPPSPPSLLTPHPSFPSLTPHPPSLLPIPPSVPLPLPVSTDTPSWWVMMTACPAWTVKTATLPHPPALCACWQTSVGSHPPAGGHPSDRNPFGATPGVDDAPTEVMRTCNRYWSCHDRSMKHKEDSMQVGRTHSCVVSFLLHSL